jgi:ABC-type transporter Mla subunit MlaD
MARREGEIDELRVRLAAAATRSEVDRRHIDDEVQRHTQERARLEERTAANERRLLGELDRARQDAKQAKQAIVEAERRSQASLKGLEVAKQTLNEQLTQAEAALQSAQQALAATSARSLELRDLLDQEQTTTRDALERLNRHIADAINQAAAKAAHKNPTMALRSKRLSARKG